MKCIRFSNLGSKCYHKVRNCSKWHQNSEMKFKTEFSNCEKTVFELVSRTCLQQVTFVFRGEVWKRMNSAQYLTFSRKIRLINYPYQLQSSIVNLLFFQTLFSFSSRESRGFKKLKNEVLNSNSNIKANRYPPIRFM